MVKRSLSMGITIVAVYLLAATAAMAQTTWIVDQGGGNDFTTIQGCIDSAKVVAGDTCQVNAGTYMENIKFSGKNITVKSASGPKATIIDGNVAGSVVAFVKGETVNAVLDGFTIRNGSATSGGGIVCLGSSPTVTNCSISNNTSTLSGGGMANGANSSPTVTNCSFSNNTSTLSGGGMANSANSSPTVTNCSFSGNTATENGGGMYNSSYSSPTVTNCSFSGNTATENGGGMSNWQSSPTVINCTFSENSAANYDGGGMDNYQSSSPTVTNCTFSENSATEMGGGMVNRDNSSPAVSNCTFSGNTANFGGGMNNYDSSYPTVTNCAFSGNWAVFFGGGMSNSRNSSPTVTNCSFSGNVALVNGGGMANGANSSPTVTNCILWGDSQVEIYNNDSGSSPSVTFSDIQGSYTVTGNIDTDPLFVDPDGPDDVPGTEDDDLHLKEHSPCIDTGTSSGAPDTDLEGNIRPQGAGYDMGAYESPFFGKPKAMPWIPLLLFGD